jgi:hypothetical protein
MPFSEDPDGQGQNEAGAQVPRAPKKACSLFVPGVSGPQDCGLICLVMSDPDLRERLHHISLGVRLLSVVDGCLWGKRT